MLRHSVSRDGHDRCTQRLCRHDLSWRVQYDDRPSALGIAATCTVCRPSYAVHAALVLTLSALVLLTIRCMWRHVRLHETCLRVIMLGAIPPSWTQSKLIAFHSMNVSIYSTTTIRGTVIATCDEKETIVYADIGKVAKSDADRTCPTYCWGV